MPRERSVCSTNFEGAEFAHEHLHSPTNIPTHRANKAQQRNTTTTVSNCFGRRLDACFAQTRRCSSVRRRVARKVTRQYALRAVLLHCVFLRQPHTSVLGWRKNGGRNFLVRHQGASQLGREKTTGQQLSSLHGNDKQQDKRGQSGLVAKTKGHSVFTFTLFNTGAGTTKSNQASTTNQSNNRGNRITPIPGLQRESAPLCPNPQRRQWRKGPLLVVVHLLRPTALLHPCRWQSFHSVRLV